MISLAQLESIGEDVWSAFTTAHNLVMQDAVTVYIDYSSELSIAQTANHIIII